MTLAYDHAGIRIMHGDALTCLAEMPSSSVQTCITSPPYYGLRDYGEVGQIGLEASPAEYVERLVGVMCEVRRVLRDDGTLFLVIGDSYSGGGGYSPDAPSNQSTQSPNGGRSREYKGRPPAVGLKPKDLLGIPWRVAFALQADGWWLRSDIIWAKPNPMPESVTDRPTKSHEYLFLLSKRASYFYDGEAIKEAGVEPDRQRLDRIGGANGHTVRHSEGGMIGATATRNRRSVWTIPTQPYPGAHFAVFPEKLVEPCVLVGSRPGDCVLDPFAGSGTTLAVAKRLGRRAVGIEINAAYIDLATARLRQDVLALVGGDA